MLEVNTNNAYNFCSFIMQNTLYILQKTLNAVCSENHSKHIHNLCGHNADPFYGYFRRNMRQSQCFKWKVNIKLTLCSRCKHELKLN
jgi:hypothetical protein